MMQHNVLGQCLCKSVEYTIENLSDNLNACHCRACQKWVGGPLMALEGTGELKFKKGKELVTEYHSSEWGSRSFCSKCGSSLYYTSKHDGKYYMEIGSFENLDDDKIHFTQQIFIDKKPKFYEFANKTKEYTEQQVFDIVAGKSK